MKIKYLGHSCFYLENERGIKLITDPFTRVGYELPSGLLADIVTVSHGHFDHNYTQAVGGSPVVVDRAGEYEIDGVKIVGKSTWHDPKQGALRGANLIFKIETDGLTVCHFGDLGESYSEKIAEILKGADIWLIPVGGTYTVDARQAWEYVEKLAPKAVIPMHYRPQDGALDIEPVHAFLELVDKNSVLSYPNGEISLAKEDLKDGERKIIYMERSK